MSRSLLALAVAAFGMGLGCAPTVPPAAAHAVILADGNGGAATKAAPAPQFADGEGGAATKTTPAPQFADGDGGAATGTAPAPQFA
jgi:hypothetical protein